MAKANAPASWLAHITTTMGGGSWYRGKTKEEAVKRCVKIFQQDWSGLFKFKKGVEIKVNVFDVTGMGEVFISDNGVQHNGEYVPRHSLETVTL